MEKKKMLFMRIIIFVRVAEYARIFVLKKISPWFLKNQKERTNKYPKVFIWGNLLSSIECLKVKDYLEHKGEGKR